MSVSNYVGVYNLANGIGIARDRIKGVTITAVNGVGTSAPCFVYYVADGNLRAFTAAATASLTVSARVIYI